METVKVEGDWVIFRKIGSEGGEYAIRIAAVKVIDRVKDGVLINGEMMDATYEDAVKAVILHEARQKGLLTDSKRSGDDGPDSPDGYLPLRG